MIEVGEGEMILEDNPNNDSIAKAIAEATQEAEMEHLAEFEEENKGALADISMSSKTSQESRTESAAEKQTQRCAKPCKYTSM